jgi:hypothetical protein
MWPFKTEKKQKEETANVGIQGKPVRVNPPKRPLSTRNVFRIERLKLAMKKLEGRDLMNTEKYKNFRKELKIREATMNAAKEA